MSELSSKWLERKDRASAVLFKAERYISMHGIPATFLSEKATGNMSLIGDIRSGCIPRHESMDKLEAFMEANPNGVPYRGPVQPRSDVVGYDEIMAIRRGKFSADALVVDRDPCYKCGVRKDVGCKHSPKTEPVPLTEAFR